MSALKFTIAFSMLSVFVIAQDADVKPPVAQRRLNKSTPLKHTFILPHKDPQPAAEPAKPEEPKAAEQPPRPEEARPVEEPKRPEEIKQVEEPKEIKPIEEPAKPKEIKAAEEPKRPK